MTSATTSPGDINLHRLVETVLRNEIDDGVLRPGGRLPSEQALRVQFGVSRSTVRQALDTLERDGLIERHVGRGTFVLERSGATPRRRRMARDWQGVIDLAAEARHLVRQGIAPPSAQVEAIFGNGAETPFAILTRSRKPELGVKRYLRGDLAIHADAVLCAEDFRAALGAALDGPVELGRFWSEAILAEPRFATLLNVTAGSPLHSFWWVLEMAGRPIACVQALLAGGAFSLNVVGEAL